MSRFGVIWFILVIASGMTNFLVKQNVQGLDDQLTAVRKKTVAEQKAIHELTADWTFLNQPELLADLNNRYVHLAAVSPKQVITSLDGIPLRPTPPPAQPQEAAAQIAEATAAPPPTPVAAPRPPSVATVAAAAPVVAPAPSPASIIPVSAPVPVRPPATPLSVITVAHAAEPPAAPAPRPAPAPAKPAASLDGLFAQVAGDH
jgi:hypothetical protein